MKDGTVVPRDQAFKFTNPGAWEDDIVVLPGAISDLFVAESALAAGFTGKTRTSNPVVSFKRRLRTERGAEATKRRDLPKTYQVSTAQHGRVHTSWPARIWEVYRKYPKSRGSVCEEAAIEDLARQVARQA
ncbi:hypothetical protein HKX48_009434 [Thoreauomyces humboldtii]|nr:hypothetical protein HKX48_009434 [Thoreauomyces humboldtii]